jgi:hypothetical protein
MKLKTLYDKHQGKCCFCRHMTCYRKKGMPPAEQATRDHFLPRTFGGRNGVNVVLASARCNALKATMPAEVFVEIAKKLPSPIRFLRGKERFAAATIAGNDFLYDGS